MVTHQLPTPQEAEGAFVALTIDSFPAQSGGGGAVGGKQMKVAAAVTVRGRKHRFALHKHLTTNWSPTGQVRKNSYFWNPVQRKTMNIHAQSCT